MRAGRFMIILAAALILTAIAAPSAPAAVTLTPYEQQTLDLVNRQRAAHKLAKVTVNAKLMAAARSHSAEMGELQYFLHTSYSGETFKQRVLRFGFTKKGYKVWKAGENIAWGASLFGTPVAIVDQWMNSPTHRAVILTKAFRSVGIGVVCCEQGFGDCPDPVCFYTLDLGRRSK